MHLFILLDVSDHAWRCALSTASSWRMSWVCVAVYWASQMFAPLPSGARPAGCLPWGINTHPKGATHTPTHKYVNMWMLWNRTSQLNISSSFFLTITILSCWREQSCYTQTDTTLRHESTVDTQHTHSYTQMLSHISTCSHTIWIPLGWINTHWEVVGMLR